MAATLAVVAAGLLVISWRFTFWGPVAFSLLAVGCQGVAVACLVREGRA